jgi:hypothetical protein
VVDQLNTEYAAEGKPVIWIEHNADDCRTDQPCVGSAQRAAIFWLAHGPRAPTEYLPLLMSDSGATFYNGSNVNWQRQLKLMVDDELVRPPQAEVMATFLRDGITATVHVEVTNLSDQPLTLTEHAQVTVVLYEDAKVIHTGRYVRAVKAEPIAPDLAVGDTTAFDIVIAGTGDMNWANAHVLAFAERQVVADGRFDMLQAALAVEGVPPTRAPTATATAAPVVWPSETPAVWPTDRILGVRIHLPSLERNWP